MQNLEKEINEKFGGRLRTRVNGVLIQDDKILMVKHLMGNEKHFWNVPGGGMDYQSTAPENLQREFLEETGLAIQVGELLTVTEYIKHPLHAVELFFEVTHLSGQLTKGTDPELPESSQLIEDVRFMDINEIQQLPKDEKHHLFWKIKSLNDVRIWKGYFNFENKCIK
ncbi:NUDIX hydrolase [Echinicola strongylocentroti]|uniref:NUDIX hydrolase n=1 Tax=Echinicola strongylocentroti TaxID=1795355 RepID=A0A2Z4ILP1_9BACT|nr:NUDIX domain-containing protein [Echinicola strongylocentroti]AWW31640.1 NUDIX hydrolase [Echinicola strongylocentroti]